MTLQSTDYPPNQSNPLLANFCMEKNRKMTFIMTDFLLNTFPISTLLLVLLKNLCSIIEYFVEVYTYKYSSTLISILKEVVIKYFIITYVSK